VCIINRTRFEAFSVLNEKFLATSQNLEAFQCILRSLRRCMSLVQDPARSMNDDVGLNKNICMQGLSLSALRLSST